MSSRILAPPPNADVATQGVLNVLHLGLLGPLHWPPQTAAARNAPGSNKDVGRAAAYFTAVCITASYYWNGS